MTILNTKSGLLILLIGLFSISFVISCSAKQSSKVKNKESTSIPQLSDSQNKALDSFYNTGNRLFNRYCNSCHRVPEDDQTESMTFVNLFEKLPAPAENYFINYICNSKQLIDSGDKYVIETAKSYNSHYIHFFKDSLSKKDLENLIIYIKLADKKRNS